MEGLYHRIWRIMGKKAIWFVSKFAPYSHFFCWLVQPLANRWRHVYYGQRVHNCNAHASIALNCFSNSISGLMVSSSCELVSSRPILVESLIVNYINTLSGCLDEIDTDREKFVTRLLAHTFLPYTNAPARCLRNVTDVCVCVCALCVINAFAKRTVHYVCCHYICWVESIENCENAVVYAHCVL